MGGGEKEKANKKWRLFAEGPPRPCLHVFKVVPRPLHQIGFSSLCRIGVNGFENPMRDPKTAEFKSQIAQGCKIKMDETGNILIKRFCKNAGIFVKNTIEENAVSNDILKLPNGLLELEKPFKLFDMKKFQQNVNRELKRSYPDRRKLEIQCISTIAFVKNEPELLDSPIWIMLINVVALEMLKAKMPIGDGGRNDAANGRENTNARNKGNACVVMSIVV